MKLQKRKALMPLAGILCAGLLTTSVSADQPKHQANKHYGTQKNNEYQRDSFKMITPEAGPKVTNGMDFFVSANYIYWRMNKLQENALAGVTSGRQTNLPNMNDGAAQGTNWQPTNDWGSGFKVAIGTDTSHDGFDVRAAYTWNRFQPASTFNVNYLSETNALNALQLLAQLNNQISLDFRYNKIDLELGRNFKLSPSLELRTHAGLTGAWHRTDYTVDQNAGEVTTLDSGLTTGSLRHWGVPGTVRATGRFNTWGVGLRTGFNYFWMFMKEFGIYSDVNANALWMSRSTRRSANVNNSVTGTSTVVSNFRNVGDDGNFVQWVADFELGLRYQAMFSDDNYGLMAQIGWEAQNWLNWTTGTDLTFQGLNVKLRFDF